MTGPETPIEVYQFHIQLEGISPMIWRRILVCSNHTLADLHYILQITLNWSNYYLHQFTIRGRQYAVSRPQHYLLNDARETTLRDLRLRINERFLYEYSFFEWWRHKIRLEKRLPLEIGKTYPFCSGGSGAAPPEDCGGVDGFMRQREHFSSGYLLAHLVEFLQYMLDEELPDPEAIRAYQSQLPEFLYWLKVRQCDRRTINRRLKWYAADDPRWVEGLEVL